MENTNQVGTLGIDVETVKYINERSKNLVKYSDKLSSALKGIDNYFEKIGPLAGIKFTDSAPFYEYNHEYFGKVELRLSVRKEWGLYAVSNLDEISNDIITDTSRATKKAVIKRLPEFLKLYAAKLAEMEKEYRDISEKAERMAEILAGGEAI